ncbi:unnamed protein product [Didymodactylos carnosus]|uniref:BZIP domain-containing protein n=1 Tax=Didymodactylos carnosus TaxID=1234261 RepID=A0A813NRI7_9BILA|nr:unnamed protein product [Didymodactylos carnosus]CAF3522120.1 unnamed protein product [Didymodactylos carnosus]
MCSIMQVSSHELNNLLKNEVQSSNDQSPQLQQQQQQQQQTNQHHRLQLLAQAVEKIENDCSKTQKSIINGGINKKDETKKLSKNYHQKLTLGDIPTETKKMSSSPTSHNQVQQHVAAQLAALYTAATSASNGNEMTQTQQDVFLKLIAQQNAQATAVAAVIAAAAALQQKQKYEPTNHQALSPPSTSASSPSPPNPNNQIDSPLDFSSRRTNSLDDDDNMSAEDGDNEGSEISSEYHQDPLPVAANNSPSPPVLETGGSMYDKLLLSNMIKTVSTPPTTPTSSTSTASVSNSTAFPFMMTNKNGKPTRPFKAYPRDPLMLPLGYCSPLLQTSEHTNNVLNMLAQAQQMQQQQQQQQQMPASTTPNDLKSLTPTQNHRQYRKRLQQTHDRFQQRLNVTQLKNLVVDHQQQPSQPPSSPTQLPPKKRHRSHALTIDDNNNTNNISCNNDHLINTFQSQSSQDSDQNAIKDEAYWERRRKNNEAAKRSRDARRAKEDEIAIRAALLEQENLKLRVEVAQLKQETAKLKCLLYNS